MALILVVLILVQQDKCLNFEAGCGMCVPIISHTTTGGEFFNAWLLDTHIHQLDK